MTQHQYYQDENKNKSASSSTTTVLHGAGRVPDDAQITAQIESLLPLYHSVFGDRQPPRLILDYLARMMRAGMEPDVIADAIAVTAWARVPTPFYMRAILERYLRQGIMTADQLMHDQAEQARRWQDRREDEY